MPECVGELFTAVKGQGSYLNGVRVHVNPQATLRTALVVVNLPPVVRLSEQEKKKPLYVRDEIRAAKQEAAIDAILNIRGRMSRDHLPGVRAYGSCAVTLSQIAAGRVDGYMDPASMAWDVCAGALLITEAGGVVTNLYGMPFDMTRDTSIVAGANEVMVDYFTQLSKEHSVGKYWLIE
ncbi:unnamed protein product [Phytomonas sp. Hart1]|nr:unnamed protein product [Phytomonas sp. Hart1]|eukprot:CCW67780.1 unnamed protein product [Phytomonas sp. isolate Hart1]